MNLFQQVVNNNPNLKVDTLRLMLSGSSDNRVHGRIPPNTNRHTPAAAAPIMAPGS